MAGNYLTAQDIAERMGIAPVTVENWIKAGFLQGESQGGDPSEFRISEQGYEAFRARQQELREQAPEGETPQTTS